MQFQALRNDIHTNSQDQ